MSKTSGANTNDCMNQCEDKFVRCTGHMPSGCIEELRTCRESCRLQQSS